MIEINGFNLQSFTVGCKHSRAFSVDNVGGIIADYVLGECGANNSPLPKDVFQKVRAGPGGVELLADNETHRFISTQDRVTFSEKTSEISESIENEEIILEQAKYLLPEALSYMNNPKVILLGYVWQLTEKQFKERERFKHPAAKSIYDKSIKLKLLNLEYPVESAIKLSFRKILEKSYFIKGMDDYINIILNIGDFLISDLWHEQEKSIEKSLEEKPRITTISIDIQRMFEPHRELNKKSFEIHYRYCNKVLKERIKVLLGEIGF